MFRGLSRTASNLMICPLLLDHVREVVEGDAKLQKALRLGREEREHGRLQPKHHPNIKNRKKEGE